ncbi:MULTISPECIES: ATPase, T2SS/T4P/T4SS family [unclassified Haloferax]|jgi:flagellar protein FlaI|uniref:ATPase, T2SS/T4P/T4SS family n=1 Tax=unclassified Haloferax TaxID=2625095 RepID=UPI00287678A1|nr:MULTISPECIES: ATPase, T2SS/T4P/T4SS family [unclassified Haloferax]MDS0243143.1 Flp pilus assembly complex ATPase component TadA [Haloferax sp. S2CR25]MDS0446264.1 Flp pilus assembly complex ATPase component TadA [Haloferax sp. S2CR25-2]
MATSTNTESALTRPEDFDPGEFFRHDGEQALVGPEDLERIIPKDEKPFLDEIERYWLNKPYSFAVVYHSRRENELVYYAIEPYLDEDESKLLQLLDEQVRIEIEYDAISVDTPLEKRIELIQDQARELLRRWKLISRVDLDPEEASWKDQLVYRAASFLENHAEKRREDREGTESDNETVRTAPVIRDEEGERTTLTPAQIDKLTYYLVRNFVGFQRIDPLKHDVAIEDITCNGPDEEIFVDHQSYETIRVANIQFSKDELDGYVKRLANSSGKGISRRQPSVDTTLRDGSRAQLTLSEEISTKGSNFTIRQFLDIPFTPIDLVNWGTYSLDQMVYIWFAIEHGRSVIFAGGTASGKTTTLNAANLFAPSNAKFVTIEDTPELELPQKNWTASITRQAVTQEGMDAIEEYDLLENALRQRPTYIIMGEVRGEEGQTLFQAMGSGHTSYTTFHATNPDQLIKRFSSEKIGVPKSYLDMLDLVVMQKETRVNGNKVRRSPEITEFGDYDDERDAIDMETLYKWEPTTDEYQQVAESDVLEDIRIQLGWSEDRLIREIQKRKSVLAYLIKHNYNTYGQVAGTIQAFMRDEEAILTLMANEELGDYLQNFQNSSTLEIDVDPEREALVPRPDPSDKSLRQSESALSEAAPLLEEYEGRDIGASFTMFEDVENVETDEESPEPDAVEELPELEAADEGPLGLDAAEEPLELEAADADSLHDVGEDSEVSVLEPAEDGEEADPALESETDDEPVTVGTENDEVDAEDTMENIEETEYPERCVALTQTGRRCKNSAEEDAHFCYLPAHNVDDVDETAEGWDLSESGESDESENNDEPDAESLADEDAEDGADEAHADEDSDDAAEGIIEDGEEVDEGPAPVATNDEEENTEPVEIDGEEHGELETVSNDDSDEAAAAVDENDGEEPEADKDDEEDGLFEVDDEELNELFADGSGRGEDE